jgi:hypothetical protein
MPDVTGADKHRFYCQDMADPIGPSLVSTKSGGID